METYTSNLSSSPETMENKKVPPLDKATAGAHQTIDKVSESLRPAVDRLAANAHHVVDNLAGIAASATDTIGVKGEQLKQAKDRLTDATRDYVRENPLTSLGIAVAGGLLLSRLLSSR